MASNADFVQYIADQCGGAGEIVTKKMFGDYGIYCNGKGNPYLCKNKTKSVIWALFAHTVC